MNHNAILVSGILILLVPSCATRGAPEPPTKSLPTVTPSPVLEPPTKSLPTVTPSPVLETKKKSYDPNATQTANEKAEADRLMVIYYRGLTASIRELDDGTSPADVIARGALAQNYSEYKDWRAAKVHHLRRKYSGGDALVDARLNDPVDRKYRDEAVALVLRHRNGTLKPL